MKKILLLLIPVSLTTAKAQVTITAAQIPAANTMFLAADINTPPSSFPFSTSGTNQTWDFTGLTPQEQDTTFFMNPATTPGASFFPTATIALRSHIDPFITYLGGNSAQANKLGMYGDVAGTGVSHAAYINPPIRYYNFPFTYPDAINSSGIMSLQITGAEAGQATYDSVKLIQHLSRNAAVVAWGNLILPAGSFPGTLLLRNQDSSIDSIFVKGSTTAGQWVSANVNSSSDSSYAWLSGNSVVPYANVTFSSGQIDDIGYFESMVTAITSPFPEKKSFLVTPNPVSNYISLDFIKQSSGNAKVIIYKSSGEKVIEQVIPFTTGLKSININSVEPGFYFINVMVNNEFYYSRFLKL